MRLMVVKSNVSLASGVSIAQILQIPPPVKILEALSKGASVWDIPE